MVSSIPDWIRRSSSGFVPTTSRSSRSMRDLGRIEGISGARVCQILRVLELAPEILERVDMADEHFWSGERIRDLIVEGKALQEAAR